MKHNHAIIDPQTGLVSNIVLWDGREWQPPRGQYVVHDCDGLIGDYWDQDNNCFYTINGKRRYRDVRGKCGEKELNEDEKSRGIFKRIEQIYTHAKALYPNWDVLPDVTHLDVEIPQDI